MELTSNVLRFPVIPSDAELAPIPAALEVDVAPLVALLDLLNSRGVIAADTYRLGYTLAALFQYHGEFTVHLSHAAASIARVMVNGEPMVGPVSARSCIFSDALVELQEHCAIFSHPTKAGAKRGKSRKHNFLIPPQNYRGLAGVPYSPYIEIPIHTDIFFHHRTEMYQELIDAVYQNEVDSVEWILDLKL